VVKAVSAVSSIGRGYRTREARAEPLAPFAVKHDLRAFAARTLLIATAWD
jgi:hypothetical protein